MKVAVCTSLEVPLTFVPLNNADALIPATAGEVHVNKLYNVDLDEPALYDLFVVAQATLSNPLATSSMASNVALVSPTAGV